MTIRQNNKAIVWFALLSAVISFGAVADPTIPLRPASLKINSRPQEQPFVGWRLPVVLKESMVGLDGNKGTIELDSGGDAFFGNECMYSYINYMDVCELQNSHIQLSGKADAAIVVNDRASWRIMNEPNGIISSQSNSTEEMVPEDCQHQSGDACRRVAIRVMPGYGFSIIDNAGTITTPKLQASQLLSESGGKRRNPYVGTAIKVHNRVSLPWSPMSTTALALRNTGEISAGTLLDFRSPEYLKIVNRGVLRGDIVLNPEHKGSVMILNERAVVVGRISHLHRMVIDNTERNKTLSESDPERRLVTLSGQISFAEVQDKPTGLDIRPYSDVMFAGVKIEHSDINLEPGSRLYFPLMHYDAVSGEPLLDLPDHQITVKGANVYLILDGLDLGTDREINLISADKVTMPSLDIVPVGENADKFQVVRVKNENSLKVRIQPR